MLAVWGLDDAMRLLDAGADFVYRRGSCWRLLTETMDLVLGAPPVRTVIESSARQTRVSMPCRGRQAAGSSAVS